MKRISQSLKTGPNAAYQLKSSFSEKRTTLMISTKIKNVRVLNIMLKSSI